MRKLTTFEDSNFLPYLFTLICAVLMSFTCSDNPLIIGNTYTDSSVYHYVARVILNGGMPYRDAFDHKGPLIHLIDACGLYINKDIGVWIMELIFIFITLLFAYKIARLIGCSKIKSMFVVFLSIISWQFYFCGCGNIPEEYAVPFIMVSLYIFLKFFKNGTVSFIELIACGFSFGAVCLLKINMAVLWVVMFFGVLIECAKKQEMTKFIKYIFIAFLGVAVIIVPIIIWLMKNDAFMPFIEDYLEFNSMYISDPQRASKKNILKAFFYFVEGAPFVCSTAILVYFAFQKKKLLDWLFVITLILSIAEMCMNGQQYGHYGMVLIPLLTYGLSRVVFEISFAKYSLALKTAAACMMIMMFANSFYFFIMGLAKSLIHYQPLPFIEAQEIASIIKDNTNENDKITVCGNNNIVYLLSGRMSSSVYSYQEPLSSVDTRIYEKYVDDLKRLDTKMLIVDKERWLNNDIYGFINENYVLVKEVGPNEVYKLK